MKLTELEQIEIRKNRFWFNASLVLTALVLFIGVCVIGASAVGQGDVLTDIRELSNYYYQNRCTDTSNISYGSLQECVANSNSTFYLNYNIGLALMAKIANLDNNQTLMNATIDGLMSSVSLQGDDGQWPQGAVLQDDGDVVQSYFTAISLADTYERIQSNLSTSQKQQLKKMFSNYVDQLVITPSTISYQGSGASFDRFSDNYYRKNLIIPFSSYNNTDNLHLYFRVNKVGNPLDNNISFYIGSSNSNNYTYQTKYSNVGFTSFLEVQLNKSELNSACPSNGTAYSCNFTFLRNNQTWNSTNNFGLARTACLNASDNRSWDSTDGVTWTSKCTEKIVQIWYYDNTTLDKVQEKRSTANQHLAMALGCYRIFRILNNTEYPISANIAQRCFQTKIDNVLADQSNGVYGEWNEMYRDFGGNASLPQYLGFSNHYNWISTSSMVQIINLTNNNTYLNSLNSTLNNLNLFIYNPNLTVSGGIGTRTQTNSSRLPSFGINKNFPFLLFPSFLDNKNSQASAINNLIKQYTPINASSSIPLSSGGLTVTRYNFDTYQILYLYENFPTSTNQTPMSSDSSRYFVNLNGSGLISVGTAWYRFYLAYYNNSQGNAIGSIIKRDGTYLFLGNADNPDYNTNGFGCINDGTNSSCFDSRTTIRTTETYPYEVNFVGNLTNPNQSIITSKTYNLTYRFYDDSFYIQQNNNAGLTLSTNLTNINSGLITYSNGSVACSDISTCNGNINITLTPNNSSCVFDNANLTEGITRGTSPCSFPITFSSIETDNGIKTYHIASTVSTITNFPVIINADCETVGDITYTSDTGAYTEEYPSGSYSCSNNQVTLSIPGIETASNSNELIVEYNQAIESICSDSGISFTEAAGIIGILLTIILIGTVLAGLVLSFSGYLNIGNIASNFSLEDLPGAILVIGLTFLVTATMAFIIVATYCS